MAGPGVTARPGVLGRPWGRGCHPHRTAAGCKKRHGAGHGRRPGTMTANSFGSRATLRVGESSYQIHRLDAVTRAGDLPFSLKVLLENLLRNEDGVNVTSDHVTSLAQWDPAAEPATEIQFSPARVIMQDLTGVPAVVDLATMREATQALGGDAG